MVDVRDPEGRGRARIHCFQIHGHFKDLDLKTLPWCEQKQSTNGSFMPVQLFQRVWVSFEAGVKYAGFFDGCWVASPAGRGTLPFDNTNGTDLRPEAFSSRDLYPENSVVASSGEGNTIVIEHPNYNDNAYNAISLTDTGSKNIKIWSFHEDQTTTRPQTTLAQI